MKTLKQNIKDFYKQNLNKYIEVTDIQEIQWGFLSRAFLVIILVWTFEEKIFLRTIKSKVWWFAYDIDRFRTFEISHEMYKNAWQEITSYGIMAIKNWGLCSNYEIWEDVDFYQIQSYREWTSFLNNLLTLWDKDILDNNEKDLLEKIAKKIAKLHNKKVTWNLNEKDLYQRWLQEVIINPEITFDITSCFPSEHKHFGNNTNKYKFISKMIEVYDIQRCNINSRKLSYLHGDFWASNILIDNDNNPFFIDYSRIPYGDAGIDIGRFLWSYALAKIITGKEVYIEAGKYFADIYIKETWDEDILKNSLLWYMWHGIIETFPPVFWDKNPDIADRIIEKILSDVEKWALILA